MISQRNTPPRAALRFASTADGMGSCQAPEVRGVVSVLACIGACGWGRKYGYCRKSLRSLRGIYGGGSDGKRDGAGDLGSCNFEAASATDSWGNLLLAAGKRIQLPQESPTGREHHRRLYTNRPFGCDGTGRRRFHYPARVASYQRGQSVYVR